MQDAVDEVGIDSSGTYAGRRIHYGFWILLAALFTNFGAIGLGRFAIGMIIPEMGADLSLTNTQLGVIASGLFLGYLGSTVISGALSTRFGPKVIIAISMSLVSFGMVLAGFASGFWLALAGQLLIGIGAGGSNVPTLGLVTRWFAQKSRGSASGIVLVGSGLGFALAGILIPSLLGFYGDTGWRASWFYLSFMVFMITVLGILVFKNSPRELGLRPVGSGSGPMPATDRDDKEALDRQTHWKDVYASRPLWELGFTYLMFGFSYVVFTTFFAKYLVEEIGFTQSAAGQLWFVVGLISLISGYLWGMLSDKMGRKNALFIVYLLQGACLLMLALAQGASMIVVISIFYALTLWSIPSIVSATCADYVGGKLAPAAIGMVTIFFGLGQVISPSLSGLIRDATQSFSIPLMVSAGANFTGAILATMLPGRGKASSSVLIRSGE